MPGVITSLNATCNQLADWSSSRIDPLLGTVPGTNKLPASVGIRADGNAPSVKGNQVLAWSLVVPAGGTLNVDLSVAAVNVLSDATATIGHINGAVLVLPTAAQNPGLVKGAQSSGITVGKAVVSPALIFGLLDGSSSFDVKPGDVHTWSSPGTGYAIGAGAKNLLLTNNDGTNAALVELAVGGTDV